MSLFDVNRTETGHESMLQRCDRTSIRGPLAVAAAALLGSTLLACVQDRPSGSEDPVGPAPPGPKGSYSVLLRWDAPQQDAEGRPLGDLAGFRLYFAPDPLSLVDDGGSLETGMSPEGLVTGLASGAWRFAVTAIDTAGNESDLSDVVLVEVGK